MTLLANPFIKSMMIFFLMTMGFDLASRTILNPNWKKQPHKHHNHEKHQETTKQEDEGVVDKSYEEKVIENGAMIKDPNEIYILTAEFCDCCGLRK